MATIGTEITINDIILKFKQLLLHAYSDQVHKQFFHQSHRPPPHPARWITRSVTTSTSALVNQNEIFTISTNQRRNPA